MTLPPETISRNMLLKPLFQFISQGVVKTIVNTARDSMRTIEGTDAWANLAKNHFSQWDKDIERFNHAPLKIYHEPKFRITNESAFFCIGSCFARNIEEHLIYRGRNVLSKRLIAPKREAPHRPNGMVNKFTSMSILNELRWAADKPIVDDGLFEETPSGWQDLQLAPGIPPVSLERAIERRHYLIDAYFSRVAEASVVIITLGLNEVWLDKRSDFYLNCAPSYASTRRDAGRYSLVVTDVAQNLEELERIRETLKMLNPEAKMIVTVSPVPMGATFTGVDVAIANTRSKSVLRVAAEQFSQGHEDVDYFPSYDIVTLAPRSKAYGPDCLHVSNPVVGEIMKMFLASYVGIEGETLAFTELGYLAANPDVDEAVRNGTLESGYDHWISCGQAENRLLMPADGPTDLMLAAGAV